MAGLMDPLMRLYDPFAAQAGAAAVTERLLLGFAACLMTHREPINTVKAVASLDLMSNGLLSAWPKPVQLGGPPVWIGSNSKSVAGRVADYADGWIVYRGMDKGDAPADLRAACLDAGRNFDDLTLSLMDAPRAEAELRGFIDAGFRKFIYMLPQAGEAVLHELDEIAALAARQRA